MFVGMCDVAARRLCVCVCGSYTMFTDGEWLEWVVVSRVYVRPVELAETKRQVDAATTPAKDTDKATDTVIGTQIQTQTQILDAT